jgi:hypothetical protein
MCLDKKWKVPGSILDEIIGFFNLPNASSRSIALGLTQLTQEMSTSNLPRGLSAVSSVTAICDPIV